ncbi:hypothetical protein E9531_17075 [Lampropedia puyangensis]|uniref:Uncharacterized protein n=1 Tax=Lampropedia puyangensis TaxID=1330072 RepID=A0A4S8END3_9BURK|nr:hypothetical protein [Lampropedia puyangensis]THT95550.1 hypothetical protein E9531_17075 [Lampropedia puyangensis]
MSDTKINADQRLSMSLLDLWTGNTISYRNDLERFFTCCRVTLGFVLPEEWTGEVFVQPSPCLSRVRVLAQTDSGLCSELASFASHAQATAVQQRLLAIHAEAERMFSFADTELPEHD